MKKCLFTLAIWACAALGLRSQLFTLGAPDTSVVNVALTDDFGSVYSGGNVPWPGTRFTLNKYFPSGALAWTFSDGSGGTNGCQLLKIAVATNGDIYASVRVGNGSVIGGSAYSTSGTDDDFLFKFSNAGVMQWLLPFTSSGMFDDILSLQALPNGNVMVLGQYTTDLDVAGFTLSTTGTHPFWTEVSSAGIPLNTVQYSAQSFSSWCATRGASGDLYFGSFTNPVRTVFKFDPAGTLIWSASSGSGNGEYWDIAVDAAGNVYGTGEFDGSMTFNGTTYYSNGALDDIFVFKVSSAGVNQWFKYWGSVNADNGYGIELNAAGELFVGGFLQGTVNFDTFAVGTAGSADPFVIKMNANGDVLWATGGGTNQYDMFQGLHLNQNTGEITLGVLQTYANTGQYGSVTMANTYGLWVKMLDNACRTIGTVFRDANANGIQDGGEIPFPNRLVLATPGNLPAVSGLTGSYSVYSDTGAYTVALASVPAYYTQAGPLSHSVSYSALGQFSTGNHFALVPTPGMNDLSIQLVPGNYGARSSMGEIYFLYYENTGTTNLTNCVVSLAFDGALTFNSSFPPASFTATDSIAINVGTLNMGDNGLALVILNIPGTLAIGAPLEFTARIHPVPGDQTPLNNQSALTQLVVNSWDPNEKRVSPPGPITPLQAATGFPLTYTIHFQNTGNAPALFVRLVDTLSTNLDLSTLEFLGASHPSHWSVSNDRVLTVDFENINLPDSSSDEPGSHGFFQYRMRTLTSLQAGDEVHNTARIYFDFNPPIVTGTVVTPVAEPAGLSSSQSPAQLQVQPNPASEWVQLVPISQAGPLLVQVTDATGRQMAAIRLEGAPAALYVGDWAAGLYFWTASAADASSISAGKIIVH